MKITRAVTQLSRRCSIFCVQAHATCVSVQVALRTALKGALNAGLTGRQREAGAGSLLLLFSCVG